MRSKTSKAQKNKQDAISQYGDNSDVYYYATQIQEELQAGIDEDARLDELRYNLLSKVNKLTKKQLIELIELQTTKITKITQNENRAVKEFNKNVGLADIVREISIEGNIYHKTKNSMKKRAVVELLAKQGTKDKPVYQHVICEKVAKICGSCSEAYVNIQLNRLVNDGVLMCDKESGNPHPYWFVGNSRGN